MFVISKLIGTIGQPPAIVLIVLILLLKTLKPLYRRLLIPFIIILYSLSIPAGSHILLAPLESWEPPEKASHSELIVVPGGGSTTVRDGGTLRSELSTESRSRLLEAIILYRRFKLPILFCGGTVGVGRSSEAEAAEMMLQKAGIPSHMVFTEDESKSTRENARNAARHTQIRNIILVTSAFHMKRAAESFQDEGFFLHACVKVAPRREQGSLKFIDFLPNSGALSNSTLALHEYGGLLFYDLLRAFS